MKYVGIALLLYIVYYTFTYAKIIWKEGNKFASLWVMLLAISLVLIPLLFEINF
jgi:hypothetical protein